MRKTSIDWCDCTVNCVKGCPNRCPYCYARRLNDRFKFVKDWNFPEFFPEVLKQLEEKTPHTIFMDSMSDVGHWKREWFEQALMAMKKNRQHKYIFLSKMPSGFINQMHKFIEGLDGLAYFGLSVTTRADLEKLRGTDFDFLSIEPLLEKIRWVDLSGKIPLSVKQFIIGAETGDRKGKVVPQKGWIDEIIKWADEHNIRVFMKESLRKIMGNDFRQDKLIWSFENEKSKN